MQPTSSILKALSELTALVAREEGEGESNLHGLRIIYDEQTRAYLYRIELSDGTELTGVIIAPGDIPEEILEQINQLKPRRYDA